MPLTHTRSFRVRHYECDAYGHLNNTNYLRYMQEAAFDASAAAGYDHAAYEKMGRIWLVRENEFEYLLPLRHGDTVEVKTWVHDFRRVRSRRVYEFRQAGSGQLAAQASTDWVFLDSTTQQPVKIPNELIKAYKPEVSPKHPPASERFPKTPPQPPGAFSIRRQIAWSDVDPVMHVNNAMYLEYIEDAGVQVSEAFGWPMSRYLEAGYGWFASRARILHLIQARFGEELEITTFLSDIKRASCIRHYVIQRAEDKELVARARILWAFTTIATGRPARIPGELLEDLAANIAKGNA
ncbi:MAG: acyl-CoA thioesterase [Chloroflexi bacterium]|nr:acyl-CoA thioesterase [Chloroflexota bacterium]